MQEGSTSYTAICDNIKKIYPGRDGNPAKAAVRGLSLALGRSECFGMLGPNGAGKTSFISMVSNSVHIYCLRTYAGVSYYPFKRGIMEE